MNLENISEKHINEVELRIKELLLAMRKAKIQPEALMESLRQLEQELGNLRRQRFDAKNSEYSGY